VQRNKNAQLRLRALADIAALRDPDAFDEAIDIIGAWPREERKEASKIMLRALVERRIGRRDQANAWIWRLAEYTRDVHEEYAVQRWPETKRLLGLLVNSAGGAHARNARRLIHAARKQDRRLAAALLAAALAHTPEAEEALRGARTRMARKPPALARELLRNFPKRRARNARRRRKGSKAQANGAAREAVLLPQAGAEVEELTAASGNGAGPANGRKAAGAADGRKAERGAANAREGGEGSSNGGSAEEPRQLA
jgi:ribonuclease E